MNAIAAAARQSAVEVKKYSLRQSRDGLIVSFVCHPNDIPDSLLISPIGQRYMLALIAVGDDEQPITDAPKPGKSEIAKAIYATKAEGEQAMVRSALYPRDARFQVWCRTTDEKAAAEYIRQRCGIKSRNELKAGGAPLDWFLTMETEYKQSTGQEAAP